MATRPWALGVAVLGVACGAVWVWGVPGAGGSAPVQPSLPATAQHGPARAVGATADFGPAPGAAAAYGVAALHATSAPAPQPGPAAADAPVAIAVSLPRRFVVGETAEMVVTVGAHAAVAEVAFHVQLEGGLLQVRGAREGGWAAGIDPQARFEARVSDGEDRVQVRRRIGDRRLAGGGGGVAVVELQALSPGTSAVLVGEIVATDASGRRLPVAPAAQGVQVLVEQPPVPAPRGPQAPWPVEPAAVPAVEIGD